MKLKQNYRIKKIGTKYMIVTADAKQANLMNVYWLNATGAFLWDIANEREFNIDSLTAAICAHYNTNPTVVHEDVERFVSDWRKAGFLE